MCASHCTEFFQFMSEYFALRLVIWWRWSCCNRKFKECLLCKWVRGELWCFAYLILVSFEMFTTLLFNLWKLFPLNVETSVFIYGEKIAPHKMFAKYSSSLEIVLEIVPVSGFLLPRPNTPQVRKKGHWSHRLKTCWNDHSSPVGVSHWAILCADRGDRRKSPSVHGAAMAIFAGRWDV